jgi:hypothetical protein
VSPPVYAPRLGLQPEGPGFTGTARALGYETEPGGERAFADAMLREAITCWLTADIDG